MGSNRRLSELRDYRIMPEEESNTGERANERIITLLEGLGWTQRGISNVDISCEKREHEQNEHGIDAYFTYSDPYLSARNAGRGILVESKSKKWNNWDGSSMNDACSQARQALECSALSEDFRQKLDADTNRVINASIVSAWSNDGEFDLNKFRGYVEGCDIKPLSGGPYYLLVLGNDRLDKLASLHAKHVSIRTQYSEDKDRITNCDFGFFYPALHERKSEPKRRDAISFEYLFSDYIYSMLDYSRLSENGTSVDSKQVGIVYTFDGTSFEELDFLQLSAREHGLLTADEIWVYAYSENTEEEDTIKEASISTLRERVLPEETEFHFSALPHVDYKSYADSILDEIDG